MSKYSRAAICLILLTTIIGQLAAQDDAICEALGEIHATHGNSLAAYLSEKGEDCLEPARTPEPTPTPSGPVWTAKGRGPTERSVSVKLVRGVYELEAPMPVAGVGKYAQLKQIISVPSACFVWEFAVFPSTVRVERDCTIHATLKVDLGILPDRKKAWEFSITRVSEELPPVQKADGWTGRGVGFANYPFEVVFEPGIYRIEQRGGPDTTWLTVKRSSPNRCFGSSLISVPTQREVKRRCHIKGSLQVGYTGWSGRSWSYSITKLD